MIKSFDKFEGETINGDRDDSQAWRPYLNPPNDTADV